jgi:hypothetical protein
MARFTVPHFNHSSWLGAPEPGARPGWLRRTGPPLQEWAIQIMLGTMHSQRSPNYPLDLRVARSNGRVGSGESCPGKASAYDGKQILGGADEPTSRRHRRPLGQVVSAERPTGPLWMTVSELGKC